MLFADFRAERGWSLQQAAVELGLSATSSSWLSEIENGKREASLRLALRIERLSGGRVSAASVCSELRDDKPGLHGPTPSVDDVATMAPSESPGAENPERNVSRTAEVRA